MNSSFTFSVVGKPAPQGSKDQFGRESCKRVAPWRADVKYQALIARPDDWDKAAPMSISIVFKFDRPQLHYRKNGELKPLAPEYPVGRIGDVDKLCRSVLDALTDASYNDDAQVVCLHAQRRYTVGKEDQGAIITVTQL